MATNNYNPNTGAKLKKGETVTIKGTNTKVTQGTTFSGGGSAAPAYNSSGTNTGAPSAEYNAYLKSLNKKGSPNYVPTPDDAGFTPVTPEKTVSGVDIPPTAPAQAQVQQPNVPQAQTNEFNNITGERLAPGSSYVNAQGQTVKQGSPFKQALAGLQSMGPAPSDAGAARGAVTGAVAQYSEPDTTKVDTFLGEDQNTNSLMQSITELLNPQKQTTSLVEDYQSLYRQSGLDKINAELIDAETVINGTEDDIRNEIQTAGGFGTDSQVQAMALARNKSLLVRYNQLAQMKTDATNQLNTLSQLNMQDKQIAQQKLNTQISAMFNLADFAQKAQNNTREQYRWLTQTMGVDGVYNAYKNDPRQLGFLEKSLGIAPGGMQSLATQAAYERVRQQDAENLKMETMRSSLETDKAQRANIYSQIEERNNSMKPGAFGIDEKTMAKIQAAPEYKTINAVLPAMQAIKAYKDAVNKWGTSEMLSGQGKGEIQGTYGNALAAWKTLAALGALSGADFGLAENAVPEPTFWARKSTQLGKIDASISNGLSQVEAMTKRLSQNYPSAAALLNSQLDDIRITADPTRVVSGSEIKDMDSILNQ